MPGPPGPAAFLLSLGLPQADSRVAMNKSAMNIFATGNFLTSGGEGPQKPVHNFFHACLFLAGAP
jgi:hypothetical protein